GGGSMSTELTTKYLGLTLKNPLVIAACPLSGKLDWLKRLEAAGAAAAVLPSLFEEQIEHDAMEMTKAQEFGTESFAEALTYFPEPQDYRSAPDDYLELINQAKKAVKIPIIASINGTSRGGWVRYAKMMQDAGADALELNVYYIATDPETSAEDVESRYLDLIGAIKTSVSIPLAVKVGPYFSAMANMAKRLAHAGADGLVLFNRFLQPDIDLDTLETSPKLTLSDPYELLVPLRWTAILSGQVNCSLAITSGIHDAAALIKALLAGADVGMIASAVYHKGFKQVEEIISELSQWLKEKEYDSVEQLKGSMSQKNCPDPEAFARGNYMKTLISFTGKPI
ncbi:MAG: dihydroorotate dehydrogenase-like protein, partial [Thermoguttaceae bacterium]